MQTLRAAVRVPSTSNSTSTFSRLLSPSEAIGSNGRRKGVCGEIGCAMEGVRFAASKLVFVGMTVFCEFFCFAKLSATGPDSMGSRSFWGDSQGMACAAGSTLGTRPRLSARTLHETNEGMGTPRRCQRYDPSGSKPLKRGTGHRCRLEGAFEPPNAHHLAPALLPEAPHG